MLKEKLDEVWRHVARCRLLAARARDCVARGSAAEHSSAYDARGFGYSVYARTNADGTPKQTANEIVAAGVGVSRSGARGLSTGSAQEEDEEEDVVAGLGAMSEREPTLPLEDAEAMSAAAEAALYPRRRRAATARGLFAGGVGLATESS